MIAALVLIALSGAPPNFDMAAICKDAGNSAPQEDAKVAYDSCVHDEQAALDKLKDRWPRYSAAARADCLGGENQNPSYVELWTCVEMQPGGSLSLPPDAEQSDATPAGGRKPLPPHAQPKP